MSTMTSAKTATFTAAPWTTVELAEGVPDAFVAALEADGRAIAPVGSYDAETRRLEALFQVISEEGAFVAATAEARFVFDDALRAADLDVRTQGIAIVEGDDPDQLP